MVSFAAADLASAAGVDPWRLADKVNQGDPEQIAALATEFYRAGHQQAEAAASARRAQSYVHHGYLIKSLNASAEAAQAAHLRTASEHLPAIAKVLGGVAEHLNRTIVTTNHELAALDHDIRGVQARFQQWASTTGRLIPAADADAQAHHFVTDAVVAVRRHGAVIQQHINTYEHTLARSTKTLADLGYVPPADLDEGPGDVVVPDAAASARSTIAATRAGAGATAKLNASTRYLATLIARAKSGVVLSGGEQAWLTRYYATLAPHLAELKQWGDGQARVTGRGVPDPKLASSRALAVVGDGLLTLTKQVPYDQLPSAVRGPLDGHVGTTTPDTPGGPHLRHIAGDILMSGDQHKPDPTLTSFDTLTGFLNHYSSHDQTAGAGFEHHLVSAALRYKHELNVIYANGQSRIDAANQYDAGPGDSNNAALMSPKEFAQTCADSGSSDALDLVSRDHVYSNYLLHDDAAVRRTVMGLNWQSGQGAGHLLLSGTLPGHGVSAHAAATTALDVVRDTASDYHGLASTANHDVKTAIAGVGAAYIDSFATRPGEFADRGQDLAVGDIRIPGGGTVTGLHLDNATYANYLKFVADSDPKIYANFQTLADQRGVFYVHHALDHGGVGSDAYDKALEYTSQLSGGLEGAGPAVLNDLAGAGADADRRKLAHDQFVYAQQLHAYERDQMLAGSVKTVIGLTPFASVLDIGDTVAGLTGAGDLDSLIAQGEPEGVDLARYTSNLDQYVSQLSRAGQRSAAALSTAHDHLASTIIAANAAAGHPVIDPDTGAPAAPGRDGHYSPLVISHVFDRVNSADADHLADAIQGVYASRTPTNFATGHAPNDDWATGSTTTPTRYSLSDPGGNWSNEDDRYKILYGDAERYVYDDGDYTRSTPSDWHGSHESRLPTGG